MNTHTPVRICADTAQWLIENGAEVAAVQDAVEHLGMAFGMADAECFAMPTGVMLTLVDPAGFSSSAVRRIRSRTINLERLMRLQEVIDRVCRNPQKPGLVRRELEHAAGLPSWSQPVRLGAAFAAAGGFALFFGGGIFDGLAAGVIGSLWQILRDSMAALDSRGDRAMVKDGPVKPGARIPEVFYTILGGFVVVFAAGALGAFFPVLKGAMISKGVLMLLVPGLAFVQAIRDLVSGQLVASVSRFADVLLTALGIAGGAAGALELVHLFWPGLGGMGT